MFDDIEEDIGRIGNKYKIKQFVVVMYYPIDLAKAVIAEEGISEVDVREKIEMKYPKWVIEEIKEVT